MQASELKQEITNATSKPDTEPMFQIAKLMSMKDSLQGQIFMGVLYRKCIIWADLNITSGGKEGEDVYGHQKVVEIFAKISEYKQNLNYLPGKLTYDPISESTPGVYTSEGELETSLAMQAMILNIIEMEQLIKKSFLFSQEKREQFLQNNPVQQTLRAEVQMLNEKILELEAENRKIKEIMSKNDSSGREMDDQSNLINRLQRENNELKLKDQENERTKKDNLNKITEQNRKLKMLQENYNQMKQIYMPKLKSTVQYQKELMAELQQVREDTELLPGMFREEAKERLQLQEERKAAEEKMSRAIKEDSSLRKQVRDLTAEVERKKRLAMQAIAARHQVKDTLKEAQDKVSHYEAHMSQVNQQVQEAKAERDKYEQRHDEMFAAVSGLNARIEELENHKLHLLQKLKKYGDKGDLGYIIKTQKLENVKGKEFANRVVVEDYKPEELRKQRDAEFAEKQASVQKETEDQGAE